VSSEIRKEIVSLLLKHNYPIVEIPDNIKTALGEVFKTISYKDFCSNVLMPSINGLDSEIRDRQIITLLLHAGKVHNTGWAKELLIQTPCIPTKPNGLLRRPGDLIAPKSLLAPLFDEHDECFPTDTYMKSDKIVEVLKNLGMPEYRISLAKLKDRASSVAFLDNEGVAVQRAKQALLYIARVYCYSIISLSKQDLLNALLNVPFIPVCKSPQGISLPWYKSSLLFQCPKDVFDASQINLVFAKAPVVMKFDDISIPTALNILSIGSVLPSIELVARNLGSVVEFGYHHVLNDADFELLNNCCPAMYNFLCQALTSEAQIFLPEVDALKNLPFICQGDQLLFAKQVDKKWHC